MHMYVQRANLPHAIAAGSFESPLTALTVNTQSDVRKKHEGKPWLTTVLWSGRERLKTSTCCPGVKKN